jgi:N-acetylglucosaminyldiphosphoundecaprenol N-acetyl-beta-D-mannosaminyltransferase
MPDQPYRSAQEWPPKEDVFGTGISITTFEETMALFERPPADRAMTVNACNVHSVMSAREDRQLAEALAAGDINTSDGVPLVWVLRQRGFRNQSRMYGPDLAEYAFQHGLAKGWKHFFYGSTEEVLERLVANVRERFAGIQIAGTYAPPFRALDEAERTEIARRITDSGAHIVWVGLGMPKQEKWMYEMRDQLPGKVLVGVGAAFDFLAGTKPQAPAWMQKRGLEWAFRMGTEPRRLWRRYLWNNPAFLLLWLRNVTLRE